MLGLPRVLQIALAALIVTSASTGAAEQNANLPQAIAEAVAARRLSENAALLLDRNLDQEDVGLLSDRELNSAPIELEPWDKGLERTPSGAFTASAGEPGASMRYRYEVKVSTFQARPMMHEDLHTDRSVSPPVIKINLADPIYPTVSIPRLKGKDGTEALYYFEFDTSPSFNSPNLWRYPVLKPIFGRGTQVPQNLGSRAGLSFDVFTTPQRNVDGHANEIRFPFRATAMRLPDWSELDFAEMLNALDHIRHDSKPTPPLELDL